MSVCPSVCLSHFKGQKTFTLWDETTYYFFKVIFQISMLHRQKTEIWGFHAFSGECIESPEISHVILVIDFPHLGNILA